MTTSVLMTHGRYLNEHDLQVLRDYALEAPWNWRMAFDQLIEIAQQWNGAYDLRDEVEEHKKLNVELAKNVQAALLTLGELKAAKSGDELSKATEKLHEQLSDLAVLLGKEM